MKAKQPLHKVILSVFAALFGVQSSKKAGEDFEEPSPWIFVIIGIILIVLLVFGLVMIVSKVTVHGPMMWGS